MTLKRNLGLIPCAFTIISNMIGTGIFTTTGFLAADLGSPKLIIFIWIVGGIISLTGALTYAELGVNFSASGGEYLYIREAYGRGLAFITGWLTFVAGFAAPVAAAAIAFSAYMSFIFPQVSSITLSVFIIFSLTLLNFLNIDFIGKLQSFLTAIKIGVITLLLFFGFKSGSGNWDNLSTTIERTSTIPIVAQFSISLVFVLFSFSGWNAVNYILDEVINPRRTLPKSIALGLSLTTLIYILLNILFIYALPLNQMIGVIQIGAKTTEVLLGKEAAIFVSLLFGLALLSSINAMILVGPRIYYAMAKDGLFPRWAASVHTKWSSPWVSTLLQGLMSIFLILTQSFSALITYVGLGISLFSALTGISLLILRRRNNWIKIGVNNFLYPLIPSIYILSTLWIFVYSAIWRPESVIATFATLAIAGGVYFLLKKKLVPLDRH